MVQKRNLAPSYDLIDFSVKVYLLDGEAVERVVSLAVAKIIAAPRSDVAHIDLEQPVAGQSLGGPLRDQPVGVKLHAAHFVLLRIEPLRVKKNAGRYLESIAGEQLRSDDIDAAIAWSEGLPIGDLKFQAMDRVASRYVNGSPEAAWAAAYASNDSAANIIEEVRAARAETVMPIWCG
jgi:hypothetical protein